WLTSRCSCYAARHTSDLHSFPTRRSSDLVSRDSITRDGRNTCGTKEVEQMVQARFHPAKRPAAVDPVIVAQHVGEFLDRGENERSEEHTSELQSRGHLVCRLLLEKKNVAI